MGLVRFSRLVLPQSQEPRDPLDVIRMENRVLNARVTAVWISQSKDLLNSRRARVGRRARDTRSFPFDLPGAPIKIFRIYLHESCPTDWCTVLPQTLTSVTSLFLPRLDALPTSRVVKTFERYISPPSVRRITGWPSLHPSPADTSERWLFAVAGILLVRSCRGTADDHTLTTLFPSLSTDCALKHVGSENSDVGARRSGRPGVPTKCYGEGNSQDLGGFGRGASFVDPTGALEAGREVRFFCGVAVHIKRLVVIGGVAREKKDQTSMCVRRSFARRAER